MERTTDRCLTKLSIEGFKSIRELKDFEMKNLNILIGANGSGKSNFIEIFRLVREMVEQRLQGYVNNNGRADRLLFNGPKQTLNIKNHFSLGSNEYRFEMWRTIDQKLQILNEEQKYSDYDWQIVCSNSFESKLKDIKDQAGALGGKSIAYHIYDALSNWVVYHFHDTGRNAAMKGISKVVEKRRLTPDASNIASVLLDIKQQHIDTYKYMIQIVKLIAPYLDDLILEPETNGEYNVVKLLWKQKGSESIMEPFQFSDGTLRLICLLTAMMQPNPPSTIIIDEPELGLHPEAIFIISDIMKTASDKIQIIAATQSPTLIDYFEPEDIIVVNRLDGSSTFQRLQTEDFNVWLEEYTLGQLWRKNVIEGGTYYESD